MQREPASNQLPESLRGYFWDYDADRLSWDGSRNTIVKRLLQSGGMDAVAWLRAQMSDDEIRDFIVRRRGRGMEPRRLRFWSLVVGIPRVQVDGWIAVARSNPWNRRTHR
ncbi:MAG: DUF6922 domain-containing protein [Longimicrobiaceae bacterium]